MLMEVTCSEIVATCKLINITLIVCRPHDTHPLLLWSPPVCDLSAVHTIGWSQSVAAVGGLSWEEGLPAAGLLCSTRTGTAPSERVMLQSLTVVVTLTLEFLLLSNSQLLIRK